jgi:hypothetical protein
MGDRTRDRSTLRAPGRGGEGVAWTARAALVAFGVISGVVVSTPASAYPSSVVFAPTGEALGPGEYSAFAYGGLTFRAKDPQTGEYNMQLSSTWVGGNVGIVPSFSYGKGFRFGGIEVGANLSAPDELGDTRVMPTFDFKINFLAEKGDFVPSMAFGVIGFSTVPQQAFNFGYVSFTKTLKWNGPSFGSLSIGVGGLLIPASQRYPGCLTSGEPCAIRGAPPFNDDSNVITIFGYASPEFGPLSFAVDQVGGTSMLSSLNFSVNLKMVEGAYISLGAVFANDRRPQVTEGPPADGMFFMVSLAGNGKDIFAPPHPAATPETTPSSGTSPPVTSPALAPAPVPEHPH